MLGQRVLTAFIGGALFVALLWHGGLWWAGLWALLAALGAHEYGRMLKNAGYSVPVPVLAAAAAALAGLGYLWTDGVPSWPFIVVWQGLTMLFLGLPVAVAAYDFRSSAVGVLGLVYTGWLPAALVALAAFGRGALLGFWLAVWLTDIGAYFGGYLYGKRKLIVRISPGKTWEGAVTGTAVAVAGVTALSSWLSTLGGFPTGWQAAALAAIVSVFGQCGDLVESMLKRHCSVKDSGRLLPGHGGVLDRFDSALFAAPAAVLLLRLLTL